MEIYHILVIAVHKVDLESLDSHFRIVLADLLHITVKCPVASPENQAHIAFCCIFHKHFKVDLRHYLEEVGSTVHRPALIKDDILDAILRSEIDVVLVGVIVDS